MTAEKKRGRPKKLVRSPETFAPDYWPPGPSIAEREYGKFVPRRLEGLRAGWEAGNVNAARFAAQLCIERRVPAPEWLLKAVLQLVDWHFDPPKKKQGRFVLEDIHFERWDTINVLRHRHRTLEGAMLEAVEVLAGKPAQGQLDAMRNSYKYIERVIAKGEHARLLL